MFMIDWQLARTWDFAPLALAIGIPAAVRFLPISRRECVLTFVAALAGVVVPVAVFFVAFDQFASEFESTTRYAILFWSPVLSSPAFVLGVEALRARRISWRGAAASTAFVSTYCANLLFYFFRAGEPFAGTAGTISLVGWLLAPAAIVAVAYSLGVWRDDKLREARERAAGSR